MSPAASIPLVFVACWIVAPLLVCLLGYLLRRLPPKDYRATHDGDV